jgi:outer membrane receptor for ferrienterochelin and colicins
VCEVSGIGTSAIVVLVLAGVAHAQPVDVDDLPPLPAAEDEPLSSATILAASDAEEDVVVGAAKREQSLGSVASAVTVVSGDRIRRFGYRTIGEAVAAVAGVYLVDNRLSYSVGIRGLQVPGDFNTRLLVLVDGATVNEAWGAYAGLGYDAIVGIEDVARIEVIRGPVSSVYGTNAFFGIINIVTRGAAEASRAWARAGAHSINGIVTSAGFAVGGVDRQLRGSAHFMDRFGDTASLPDVGTNLDQDGSSAFSAGLVAAYDGTFAQVRAVRYNRESPFAPYDVLPTGPPYDQLDTQLLVEGGHTRALSERLTVVARAYGNIYRFSDTSPPFEPVIDSPLDTTGVADTFGGELRGRYEIVVPDKLGITAGAEGSYNRTTSGATKLDGSIDVDIDLDYDLEGVYAEVDGQPLPWLGFTGGIRYDRHSEFTDKVSPRAAVFVARPEQYGLKLLYAEGFRNASAFESYFEDGTDFADNRDIRPETIRSFEAVAWAKPFAGLSARISGFYWDARDIIESRPLPPPDDNMLQFQNVTRYISRGIEAEASYRDKSGWYGFAGVSLQQVGIEDEDSGELVFGDVVNAPPITASLGVSTPAFAGIAHLSSEVIVLGERPTRLDELDQPSPASPLWVGWNVTVHVPNVKKFDLTAGVRNLVGTRDLVPTPGDYDRSNPDTLVVPRIPGEGRELHVKLGYSF